ncbi:gustatory receptor 188 [Tribolium castaneum]|uniref:Gustatory receptor 188 n=1 Tax=Tribolium castaneum TaxID=7070 RepID=D6WHM9_TRICA|nr:gustatory receptor 188 [Tribolium castaneum]
MWHPNNICELTRPVFLIWKYTGLPNFSLKYPSICDKSKTWIVGLSILVLASGSGYFMAERISVDYTNCLVALQAGMLGVQNVLTVSTLFKKRKQIGKIILNVAKIEKTISNLTRTQISYQNEAKILIKFMVLRYSCALVAMIFDIISELIYKMNVAHYHVCWNYQFPIDLIFLIIFLVIRRSYTLLKNYVKVTEPLQVQANFPEMKKIARKLDKIIISVREAFQGVILVKIVVECLSCTIGMYYTILTVVQKEFALTTTAIFYLIVQAIANFSAIVFFQAAVRQKELFIDEVDKLLSLLPQRILRYKQVRVLYGINCDINRLTFNVCGCFQLEYPTIYSMISQMSILLVYIFQFKKK